MAATDYLPIGMRSSNPGSQQQYVGGQNTEGRHSERQDEHTQNQLAELGQRLYREDRDLRRRRAATDQMKPDERRSRDDQRRRPG